MGIKLIHCDTETVLLENETIQFQLMMSDVPDYVALFFATRDDERIPGEYANLETTRWACQLHARGWIDLAAIIPTRRSRILSSGYLLDQVHPDPKSSPSHGDQFSITLLGPASDYDCPQTSMWAHELHEHAAIDLAKARELAAGAPITGDHLRASLVS